MRLAILFLLISSTVAVANDDIYGPRNTTSVTISSPLTEDIRIDAAFSCKVEDNNEAKGVILAGNFDSKKLSGENINDLAVKDHTSETDGKFIHVFGYIKKGFTGKIEVICTHNSKPVGINNKPIPPIMRIYPAF